MIARLSGRWFTMTTVRTDLTPLGLMATIWLIAIIVGFGAGHPLVAVTILAGYAGFLIVVILAGAVQPKISRRR